LRRLAGTGEGIRVSGSAILPPLSAVLLPL
jgi:hypothetical protein